MTDLKKWALEILDQLNCEGRPMEYRDYSVIFDALDEIESLRCRDEALEQLWARLEDVPMNPETECIEEDFVNWPAGTHREDIWHWFDERHSKGISYLLYGVDARATSKKPTPEVSAITLRTETPLGAIIARAATDPAHPGIYIDLRRGADDPDMPLALVEFSADDADFMDGVENLITRVWGDAMQEDYTERVVHLNVEKYFTTEEAEDQS